MVGGLFMPAPLPGRTAIHGNAELSSKFLFGFQNRILQINRLPEITVKFLNVLFNCKNDKSLNAR